MYHEELVSVTLLRPRSPCLACLSTAASLATVSPDSTFCQGNTYLLRSVLELLFCHLLRCPWKPFSCSKACTILEVEGYEDSLGQLLTKGRRKRWVILLFVLRVDNFEVYSMQLSRAPPGGLSPHCPLLFSLIALSSLPFQLFGMELPKVDFLNTHLCPAQLPGEPSPA